MNHHLARTVIIQERSGSMAEFLGKLKGGPADTALAQFEDEYETWRYPSARLKEWIAAMA